MADSRHLENGKVVTSHDNAKRIGDPPSWISEIKIFNGRCTSQITLCIIIPNFVKIGHTVAEMRPIVIFRILLQLPFTTSIATVIITQPVSRYSFYRPTKGGRLSRPRHYSEVAQPVPEAAYRSGCRDKHT